MHQVLKTNKIFFLLLLISKVYSFELIFNNHVLFDIDSKVQDIPLGGLSGLRYDELSKKLYVVSDDRSKQGPARFYQFDAAETNGKVEISVNQQILLKDNNGNHFKKNSIDFEDIEFLGENEIVLSDEGGSYSQKIYPPRLVVFNKTTGEYVRDLLVNERFTPKRENGYFISGVRDNLAFESITISPSKNSLFFATEDALHQDGPVASLKQNSLVRISKYQKSGSGLVPSKEFIYSLGPIQSLENSVKSVGAQTGIPAVIATDDSNLLVLERTYYPVVDITKLLLFKVNIPEDAKDYSGADSLKNEKISSLKKDILFDFDAIIPKLKTEYQFLDNVEGMCLGPKLSNGNRTLILVSDNNFSKAQRTHFLVMEIKE